MSAANVLYALRQQPSPAGDPESAFRMLILLQDTYEGIVRPYDPTVNMIGAVNREGVTCFLDGLLFAMFARLDSFEAMLYPADNFPPARRKLAGLLRLWVNMLRTGRLITTDITAHLQLALADCGWEDAMKLKQQDPSEAFTFITGQLEVPLLTLKMDLYHTGKEDLADDHKFVNERLLEVALLERDEGGTVITLEECLEHYFNGRIEVKRFMERRRNTLQGASSSLGDAVTLTEKEEGASHVEVVELAETPTSQYAESPFALSATPTNDPLARLRPGTGRKRADSIFSQRRVTPEGTPAATEAPTTPAEDTRALRKLSTATRTEVLMPAWQFFKLLPWYTSNNPLPTSDAQVAAHFSRSRPVLGICLKRYSMSPDGRSKRRDDFVDIPLEIAVPDFVEDGEGEGGQVGGRFKLVLMSVVCHRGRSTHSGHYVTLCRGLPSTSSGQQRRPPSSRASNSSSSNDAPPLLSQSSRKAVVQPDQDPWYRFDDLARERVSQVDVLQALKDESPYLLFYQVTPIIENDDVESGLDLPTYAEATGGSGGSEVEEKPYTWPSPDAGPGDALRRSIISPRPSLSLDVGRSSTSGMAERRTSIAFDSSTESVPTTPIYDREKERTGSGFLAVLSGNGSGGASRRGSKVSNSANGITTTRSAGSKSRPTSSSGGGGPFGLGGIGAKLTQRKSRADLPGITNAEVAVPTSSAPAASGMEPAKAQKSSLDLLRERVPELKGGPALNSGKQSKKAKREKHHHGHGHGREDKERDCVIM